MPGPTGRVAIVYYINLTNILFQWSYLVILKSSEGTGSFTYERLNGYMM